MVVEKVESAFWFAGGALGLAALSFAFIETSLLFVVWFVAGAVGLTALGYAYAAARLAAQKLDAMHSALTERQEVASED